jgi:hypothetical protein
MKINKKYLSFIIFALFNTTNTMAQKEVKKKQTE